MIELHVAFAANEDAAALARRALETRLAACVNLLPVTSLYRWQGAIKEEGEVLALFKTSEARADELARFIAENHPYDTPAIIRHREVTANQDYLDWIAAEAGNDSP